MRRRVIELVLVCVGVLLSGCGARTHTRSDAGAIENRDAARAAELTRRATEVVARDAAEAERLLMAAIAADPFNGDARNNLGVIMMESGRLYEAALQFEGARKVKPDHPDPRMNLGLTFERAGRIDDAITAYQGALEVQGEYVPAMQALAMCRIRHERRHEDTNRLLREIAMRGETEAWRSWARGMLLKFGGTGLGGAEGSTPSGGGL